MKQLFYVLFAFVSFHAAAQGRLPQIPVDRPFWFILEEGKKAFREHDFGPALAFFEEARAERRERFSRFEAAFIALLSIGEVRRFGDSLASVEKYIEERNQFDAGAALAELVYRLGRDALGGSAKKALELFGRLKEYPEAEFWIGEVYRLEGENAIALIQYRKALEFHIDAEAPLWRIEVLYHIAEVQYDLQNYPQMEAALTEILNDDRLWKESNNFVRSAMTNTLSNDGINNFLLMYRYNNAATEKAHRMLGEFCYKSGRYQLAESHLAFAALEQNTVLIDEAIRKRFDFTFSTLENLMAEIDRRRDLKTYMKDVDYFRTLYYLGAALFANGKSSPARSIWAFLARRSDAGEWAQRAQNQLRSPFVEKAVIMP